MREKSIQINAYQLRTSNQFIKVIAENCQFPSYFGGGYDAMNNCMRDLSWFNEEKIVVEFNNLNQLKTKNLAMFEKVTDSINFWQSYWQNQSDKTVIFRL